MGVAVARPAGLVSRLRLRGVPTARRGEFVLLALAAVVLVASLVLLAVVVPRLLQARETDARQDAVLQAARQHAVNFTTLDYRELDEGLGRVLKGSTGDFREQFEAGTSDLKKLVTENQAVAEGEALEAGIVTVDDDSARVLVVADSTVTNAGTENPDKRHYRIQMDLVREGERWLVSDLEFVG